MPFPPARPTLAPPAPRRQERVSGYTRKDFKQAKYDFVEQMLAWSGSKNPATILDVGCGIGGTSRYLANKFPQTKVTGEGAAACSCNCARACERVRVCVRLLVHSRQREARLPVLELARQLEGGKVVVPCCTARMHPACGAPQPTHTDPDRTTRRHHAVVQAGGARHRARGRAGSGQRGVQGDECAGHGLS